MGVGVADAALGRRRPRRAPSTRYTISSAAHCPRRLCRRHPAAQRARPAATPSRGADGVPGPTLRARALRYRSCLELGPPAAGGAATARSPTAGPGWSPARPLRSRSSCLSTYVDIAVTSTIVDRSARSAVCASLEWRTDCLAWHSTPVARRFVGPRIRGRRAGTSAGRRGRARGRTGRAPVPRSRLGHRGARVAFSVPNISWVRISGWRWGGYVRVLGVDPGLTRCGLGVVEGRPAGRCGWSRSTWCGPPPGRHRRRGCWPSSEAVEAGSRAPPTRSRSSGTSASTTSHRHGHRAGQRVAILAPPGAASRSALHTPSEIKAAVTGSGRADKAQVGAMVTRILRLDELPGRPTPPMRWPWPSATSGAGGASARLDAAVAAAAGGRSDGEACPRDRLRPRPGGRARPRRRRGRGRRGRLLAHVHARAPWPGCGSARRRRWPRPWWSARTR